MQGLLLPSSSPAFYYSRTGFSICTINWNTSKTMKSFVVLTTRPKFGRNHEPRKHETTKCLHFETTKPRNHEHEIMKSWNEITKQNHETTKSTNLETTKPRNNEYEIMKSRKRKTRKHTGRNSRLVNDMSPKNQGLQAKHETTKSESKIMKPRITKPWNHKHEITKQKHETMKLKSRNHEIMNMKSRSKNMKPRNHEVDGDFSLHDFMVSACKVLTTCHLLQAFVKCWTLLWARLPRFFFRLPTYSPAHRRSLCLTNQCFNG